MGRVRIGRALLLAGYCVPYAGLALYGDARYGTMALYAVLIAAFLLLSAAAARMGERILPYVGTMISLAASLAAQQALGLDGMNAYFKPLTARELMLIVTAGVLLGQTVCMRLAAGRGSAQGGR